MKTYETDLPKMLTTSTIVVPNIITIDESSTSIVMIVECYNLSIIIITITIKISIVKITAIAIIIIVILVMAPVMEVMGVAILTSTGTNKIICTITDSMTIGGMSIIAAATQVTSAAEITGKTSSSLMVGA